MTIDRFLFLFLIFISLATTVSAQTIEDFFQQTDDLLATYVHEELVDYQSLHNNRSQLDALVDYIAKAPFQDFETDTRKAFWINAYNLLVLQSVIDHYPTASPQSINGFFDKKNHLIHAKKYSLNQVEKNFLLATFNDPKLHFVLVCAAKSCPPLANFAYRPALLNQQLSKRTYDAINNPFFIKTNPEKSQVFISPIFNWYAADFKRSGGALAFVNQYLEKPIPTYYKVKYANYDWSLNDTQAVASTASVERYTTSSLLNPQQVEIKLFNALYTQRSFDGYEKLNSRSSFFSSFAQVAYGLSDKWNVGFDLVYKSNVVNDFSGNSPFKTLYFQRDSDFPVFDCNNAQHTNSNGNFCDHNGMSSDTLRFREGEVLQRSSNHAWAHFGPKFKLNPIQKWQQLSLQQTFYIPINKAIDGQFISFTQLFFDHMLTEKSTLFVEASLWTPVHPNFKVNPFLKVFYSYFPNNKWTIYAMANLPAEYGIGTKFLITPSLEIEALYTHYLPINALTGGTRPYTFNLGFRYTGGL